MLDYFKAHICIFSLETIVTKPITACCPPDNAMIFTLHQVKQDSLYLENLLLIRDLLVLITWDARSWLWDSGELPVGEQNDWKRMKT